MSLLVLAVMNAPSAAMTLATSSPPTWENPRKLRPPRVWNVSPYASSPVIKVLVMVLPSVA